MNVFIADSCCGDLKWFFSRLISSLKLRHISDAQYFQDPSLAQGGQRPQRRGVFSQDGEDTAREPETQRSVAFKTSKPIIYHTYK